MKFWKRSSEYEIIAFSGQGSEVFSIQAQLDLLIFEPLKATEEGKSAEDI